jgi:hypothetical protein
MRHEQLLRLTFALAVSAFVAAPPAFADQVTRNPALDAIGIGDAQLDPEFWVAKLEDEGRVMMARPLIEAQNAKLMELDPSMHDLHAFPDSLTRAGVAAWIEDLAASPSQDLFDERGESIARETLDILAGNRNLAAIPERQATRYGLVVHRADLRTFPTSLRVFRSPGNTDIDRFQESALFPGTPVVIAHESGDGDWWFVVSPRYAAWIEKRHVAEGGRAEVLGYLDRTPYRVVTGATVETVFNPGHPALSELQLDMGVRVPVLETPAATASVNGQHPYTAHVIQLPVRAEEGQLRLRPALLQKNADTAGDYLPLTRENIIRQGFKFLGERYGWGHSYNGRDCSGFVSEVYQSMGATMPRNTSAQSVSPALEKRIFDAGDSVADRLEAARSLDVGDLVYIPGHVMMVIGSVDGAPWVIHDTTGFSYRAGDGEMVRVPSNAVSVTPLLPLQFNDSETYVDRMTSIVKIVPGIPKEASPSL